MTICVPFVTRPRLRFCYVLLDADRPRPTYSALGGVGCSGMSAFSSTVVGVVVGGIISAAISYYFARKASKVLCKEAGGLLRETEDVRHYVNTLISYLEAAGTIEVVRDQAGRPIEIRIIKASAAMSGTGGMSATPTVVHHEQPEGEGSVPDEGDEGDA